MVSQLKSPLEGRDNTLSVMTLVRFAISMN